MMCHNPFLNQQQTKYWHDMYQQCRFPYKINIYPWVQTHAEVATFINEHDCGLFPSRAEGWNLELLETMACGTPVICTDYSAHTEFANEENAYLIDVEGTEKAHDGIWFHGQGEWAELDYEQEQQLIDYMRYCYDERPTNEAGIRTAKEYSWEKTSEKLEKILFSV
jgi:glycosyltransferase involved in cell wall biosynthesis